MRSAANWLYTNEFGDDQADDLGASVPPRNPRPDVGALIDTLLEDWAWHQHALCLGADPNMFFPDLASGQHVPEHIKAICGDCPVQQTCSEVGETQVAGIWGGTTQRTKRRHRKLRASYESTECPTCGGRKTPSARTCRTCRTNRNEAAAAYVDCAGDCGTTIRVVPSRQGRTRRCGPCHRAHIERVRQQLEDND